MLLELLAAGALQTALAPVSARDLTRLLDGVTLRRGNGDEEIVIVAGAEYYGPDGRFAVGDRPPRFGHWRAELGRVCNWSWPDHRDERCRIVMTDGRGRFYTAEDQTALAEGRTYEIRFVPVRNPGEP